MSGARAACALLVALIGACGGAPNSVEHPTSSIVSTSASMRIVRARGQSPLAVVARDGDPIGAVAAFVSTAGIGGAHGSLVPVALAGLFQSRIDGRVTPQGDGVRVVIVARGQDDFARIASALAAPVTTTTDLSNVKKKVAALAALARLPEEAAPIAACEGAIVPPADTSSPSFGDLESWRASAVVTGRVAWGIVGTEAATHTAAAPALPSGDANHETRDTQSLSIYDATGEAPSGSATLALVWRGDLRALGAARALGDPSAPIGALIASSDPGARLRSVSAALSAEGACLTLRAKIDADASTPNGAARVASIVALATREARAAIADDDNHPPSPIDATEAAEHAALVAIAAEHVATDDSPRVVIGTTATNASHELITRAITDASKAWDTRVVEGRERVENGQPTSWMLFASPCGTAGESDGDAGASAAFAFAAAHAARALGVDADPWIANDGAGVIASDRDAKKLADVLARSVIVDPLEGTRAAEGRLLESARPGLATLAEALSPGRPALFVPTGTPFALLRLSDSAIRARADALRHGPLRVAIIANTDAAHADTAIARVDRWIARGDPRACPAAASASSSAIKPGTYAIATEDGTSEAYVAAPVPASLEVEAAMIASVLDGEGGLLEKALAEGLARSYSARMLGPPGARAIVVHVDAPSSALDAAVAQVRALIDRTRQGAITDDDVTHARARASAAHANKLRDPRERVIALFRGDAAIPADLLGSRVRAAAATILHDDALVIVAARPRTSKRVP